MSEEDGGISQFSHLSYIEKNGEVNGLLSNQILQRTINEIGDIIECNCSIWNTDGVMLAAVGKEKPAVKKAVCSFLKELEVTGVSEEHLDECYGLFPVYDDDELTYIFVIEHNNEIDVHTSGRLSVCQLESLLRSGSERLDRNRFIQNLLLDNLLLVDIYSQAKKLHIQTEAMRVVYLIETRDEKDVMALEAVRSVFAPKSQDIITAVDQKNIVVVKSVGEEDTYDTLDEIAVMLAGMLNTDEDSSRIRVAYGTMVSQIRDLSKSYKEAKMALEVGKIFYPEATVNAYHTLGIGRLIYQLPQPLCEMFMQEVFHENTPDTFDEETLSTIEKFFENNLNVSETARQLFVHRNTLVYRLEKLQKTTGLDIRVFEDALTFKIALMVASYMKYLEREQL